MTRRRDKSSLPTFKTVYPYDDEAPLAVAENWMTCGGRLTPPERAEVLRMWTDEQIAAECLAGWKFQKAPERADLIAAARAYRERERE